MNFPKRVPVFAKPQDGSSMRKVSSAVKTLSLVGESIRTSFLTRRLQLSPGSRHAFFWRNLWLQCDVKQGQPNCLQRTSQLIDFPVAREEDADCLNASAIVRKKTAFAKRRTGVNCAAFC